MSYAALLSERRAALVHTLYELLFNNCRSIILRDPRPRFRQRPVELVARRAATGRIRRRGRDAAVAPPILRRIPAAAGIFRIAGAVLIPRNARRRCDSRRRISGERRNRFHDLAVRAERPVSASGTGRQRADVPPGMLADRESLSANRGADAAGSDQLRISGAPGLPAWHSMEVFSIDEVDVHLSGYGRDRQFRAVLFLPSLRAQKRPVFWNATRRWPDQAATARRCDDRWSDLSGPAGALNLDALTVRCTCTNRDLPSQLPFGDERAILSWRGIVGRSSSSPLRKPTRRCARLRSRRAVAPDFASLAELSVAGRRRPGSACRRFCGFIMAPSPYLERQVDGIGRCASARHFARVIGDHGISFVRGMRVEMEMDEIEVRGRRRVSVFRACSSIFWRYTSP